MLRRHPLKSTLLAVGCTATIPLTDANPSAAGRTTLLFPGTHPRLHSTTPLHSTVRLWERSRCDGVWVSARDMKREASALLECVLALAAACRMAAWCPASCPPPPTSQLLFEHVHDARRVGVVGVDACVPYFSSLSLLPSVWACVSLHQAGRVYRLISLQSCDRAGAGARCAQETVLPPCSAPAWGWGVGSVEA